jgi:hypothetical protein
LTRPGLALIIAAVGVLHTLMAAVLGASLGTQVFLTFLAAPAVFGLLERPLAGRVMEGLFPAYHAFGMATTGLALLLGLWLAIRAPGSPARWGVAALLALVLLGTWYGSAVLLPATRAARERGVPGVAAETRTLEFTRLHRRAAVLNVGLFLAGAMALSVHAAARPR